MPLATPPSARGLRRFRRVVIEGPIGVGKSSLARKLAQHLGAELLLEQPEDNPYLGRFYADMPGYAFQTQLFFLFQGLKQMRAAQLPGTFDDAVVAHFLFSKDALFARLNLSDDEFRFYTQMYAQIAPQVAEPDLVIWLQALPTILMQRSARRAIPMEIGIAPACLQRLCDAYVKYFHAYDGAPVFAIGTEHFNPVDRDAYFDMLLQRLAGFRGRREFFNSHVEIPFV